MANWGNTHYFQDSSDQPLRRSVRPGRDRSPSSAPRSGSTSRYGIQTITDGTSNTLLMSEVKVGLPNGTSQDHRGDVFNDDYNGCMFNGYTPPNTTFPDYASGGCQYPYHDEPPLREQDPDLQRRPELPRGRGQRTDGRRQRQVLQGLDQRPRLAGPLHHPGRRGHLRGFLLTAIDSEIDVPRRGRILVRTRPTRKVTVS